MKEKQFGVENADDWPLGYAIIWSLILVGLTFFFGIITS